jgi:hypothetical protein
MRSRPPGRSPLSLARALVAPVALVALASSGCGPPEIPTGPNAPIALAVPPSVAPPPLPVPLPPAGGGGGGGAGNVTITGQFTFEKLRLTANQAGAVQPLTRTVVPVRLVDVVALDSATRAEIQVAASVTDESGNFTIVVPAGRTFTLGIKSSTQNTAGRVNLEVRDPVTNGLYIIDRGDPVTGQPFTVAAGTTTLSVTLPPISSTPSSTRLAAVPNILDAGLDASEAVRLARGSPLPLVTFHWNANSISGTFFQPIGGLGGGPRIVIRGGNSDASNTDEFDDQVIQHEYGHFYVFSTSRDSSLGGSHDGLVGNDVLYPTLAYSEGAANWFAGVIQKFPVIVDSRQITSAAPQGDVINLETRARGSARGIRSELSVGEVFWDLVDGAETRPNSDTETVALTFAQINGVLSGLRSSRAYITINDFFSALVASAAIGAGALDALLNVPENQNMDFPPAPADVYPPTVGPSSTTIDFCQTRAATGDTGSTGLEESNRFFQVVLPTAQTLNFRMDLLGRPGTDATGTNIDLFVLDTDNLLARTTTGTVLTPFPRPGVMVETAGGALNAGTYIIEVNGRPDVIAPALTNTSSVSVRYQLDVGP